jgi:hypothetical protein
MNKTNSVELLEEALAIVSNAGIEVRHVYLDGGMGGLCRLGDKHVLFLDVTASAPEQLSLATSSIAKLSLAHDSSSPTLTRLIRSQRALLEQTAASSASSRS